MVPFERAFVSSYRPSIVTFPPSLYAFQRYCRFCSPERHFPYPTSSLPKVSHVPLGLGGDGRKVGIWTTQKFWQAPCGYCFCFDLLVGWFSLSVTSDHSKMINELTCDFGKSYRQKTIGHIFKAIRDPHL